MKYLRWLLRIATWDGLLPICVAFAPLGIKLAFPGLRGAVEITAVVLPISAFFFRVKIGLRHFVANRHVWIVRMLQAATFTMAIFLLVFLECFVILSHIMPAGALFVAKEDRVVGAMLYSLYLGSMAFALFPGPNGDTTDS